MNETTIRRQTEDLGVAAYLRMHGFKVVGRKGKAFIFEMNRQDENDFNRTSFEYANSPFYDFDSQLMVLKRMPQYLPAEN